MLQHGNGRHPHIAYTRPLSDRVKSCSGLPTPSVDVGLDSVMYSHGASLVQLDDASISCGLCLNANGTAPNPRICGVTGRRNVRALSTYISTATHPQNASKENLIRSPHQWISRHEAHFLGCYRQCALESNRDSQVRLRVHQRLQSRRHAKDKRHELRSGIISQRQLYVSHSPNL